MIYIVLNAIAIIAATLSGLAFGAAYYGIMRRTHPRMTVTLGAITTIFLAELWLCAILAGALILAPPKGGVWTMSLGSAFVIWTGFVVPTVIASYRFRAVAMRTALVDCGHWLGVMLVQAVVLRLIGLVAPA
ncbi:DUF1761 domain-containing protein [Sphingomonas radiodurans]|uniref:DUF1761 domain-containing protein n=1 Tax=Sphingomonas radiodurans TaxID=2890321 RepID=UPI001E543C7E|nr:DUF1761 domain-containing protein [Sphingomonas radiodurans]WBH15124.1 DUF1761 domain-containing protein [Sphingomonas radiodurans]